MIASPSLLYARCFKLVFANTCSIHRETVGMVVINDVQTKPVKRKGKFYTTTKFYLAFFKLNENSLFS